jgi:hypothetical protein
MTLLVRTASIIIATTGFALSYECMKYLTSKKTPHRNIWDKLYVVLLLADGVFLMTKADQIAKLQTGVSI